MTIPKKGMSLIELLIVLGLMAAIATVALTTLDGMADRTRADTSHHRLDMIEEAIVGDGLEPGRFVSDMGRLPVIHLYPDPLNQTDQYKIDEGQGLIELWDNMAGLYSHMVPILFNGFDVTAGAESEPFYDDRDGPYLPCYPEGETTELTDPSGFRDQLGFEVTVPGGWQGPYVQTGSKLFDGFGHPFHFTQVINAAIPRDNPDVWFSDKEVGLGALITEQEVVGIASYGRTKKVDSPVDPDEKNTTPWADVDEARFLDSYTVRPAKSTLMVTIRVRATDEWRSPTSENVNGFADVADGDKLEGLIVQGDDSGGVTRLYRLLDINTGSTSSENVLDSDYVWPSDGFVVNQDPGYAVLYTWQQINTCQFMNRMRAVIFAPFADPDYNSNPTAGSVELGAMRIRRISTWADGGVQGCIDSEYLSFGLPRHISDNSEPTTYRELEFQWSGVQTLTVSNLPPGIRKLLIYGYYNTTPGFLNAHSSALQTIELNPGMNHVTVYLNERLGP